LEVAIAEPREVAERDLDLDAVAAEAPWVANQGAHVVAGFEQQRKERPADGSARPCKQDHAAGLYPRTACCLQCRLRLAGSARTGRHSDNAERRAEEEGARHLAYVIAEPCIGQKDNSCVEVCPVDCIHPTPDEPDYEGVEQLYIDPDECIDCDACVEACPVDACFAEDQLPEEWAKYTQINADYFTSK
jgi:ferredoxin